MAHDIVTRLRRHADAGVPSYIKQLDTEAADEIERLRAYVLSFPCNCWVNKPKCVRCEVAEAGNES